MQHGWIYFTEPFLQWSLSIRQGYTHISMWLTTPVLIFNSFNSCCNSLHFYEYLSVRTFRKWAIYKYLGNLLTNYSPKNGCQLGWIYFIVFATIRIWFILELLLFICFQICVELTTVKNFKEAEPNAIRWVEGLFHYINNYNFASGNTPSDYNQVSVDFALIVWLVSEICQIFNLPQKGLF